MVQRRVFYSFHYDLDSWRASQVREIGTIGVEGNKPASDNDWEQVKRGGAAAIKRWITKQMERRSCTIVLVGSNTASREWVNYEICESWNNNMGVAGIYIHGLKDHYGNTASKGRNPFDHLGIRDIVKCYDPSCCDPLRRTSKERYSWIAENLAKIIEEAINIRKKYP